MFLLFIILLITNCTFASEYSTNISTHHPYKKLNEEDIEGILKAWPPEHRNTFAFSYDNIKLNSIKHFENYFFILKIIDYLDAIHQLNFGLLSEPDNISHTFFTLALKYCSLSAIKLFIKNGGKIHPNLDIMKEVIADSGDPYIGENECLFSLTAKFNNLYAIQYFHEQGEPWIPKNNPEFKAINMQDYYNSMIDPKKIPVTLYQLYLFDSERAQASNIFEIDEKETQEIKEVLELFKAVEEGSKVPGNMRIVKKHAKYITLGLINKDKNTLLDIAAKNNDISMIITLLLQNKESLDGIDILDYNKESFLSKIFSRNYFSPLLMSFLTKLTPKNLN